MCSETGTETHQNLAKESVKGEINNIIGTGTYNHFLQQWLSFYNLIIHKKNRKGLFLPASKPHPPQFLAEFSPKPADCREKYQSQKKQTEQNN